MARPSTALVINPWVMDFKLYDEWMHPVGLYFLIDMLVANGIETGYFNCLERVSSTSPRKYGTGAFTSRQVPKPELYKDIKRHYKWYGCPPEQLNAFLRSAARPDVIFVGSMMTYWVEGVVETVRCIREVFPDVPVVCGGIAVRLMPEYFSNRLPGVHLFDRLLGKESSHITFPGLSQDLIFPVEPSLHAGFQRASLLHHAPVLMSLGCPLRCSYCASKILQPEFHQRDVEAVWKEMVACVNDFGIHDFAFCDDALLVDAPTVLLPLLDRIIGTRLHVRLHTPNGLHIKYINAPLLARMREAGFTTLRFGYESGLPKHRHQTALKADTALIEEKLSLLKEYRFPDTGVYVMGGLPGGSPAEMMEEMRFIASFGTVVKPVFVSPVPGTKLFNDYAVSFPELLSNPLWQNDTFFITRMPGWGEVGVEMVRTYAKELARQGGDQMGGAGAHRNPGAR